MAHYYHPELKRPKEFNFATDVVDYWASNPPPGNIAMHWISQDQKTERKLSFEHFSRQSHRLAVLFRGKLGVRDGEKMLIIMPRLPEWYVQGVMGKGEAGGANVVVGGKSQPQA